jgi:predicted DNA-binding transcriptional regulator AlpA
MRPIQLQFTLSLDESTLNAFSEIIRLGVENGTTSLAGVLRDSVEALTKQRTESDVTSSDAKATFYETQSSLPQAADTPQLIEATEVAKILGISPRTIWRLKDAGKVPNPISIGSMVRWRRDEITDWIAAGCPPKAKWKWNMLR